MFKRKKIKPQSEFFLYSYEEGKKRENWWGVFDTLKEAKKNVDLVIPILKTDEKLHILKKEKDSSEFSIAKTFYRL